MDAAIRFGGEVNISRFLIIYLIMHYRLDVAQSQWRSSVVAAV
jgi:hypothetical protein